MIDRRRTRRACAAEDFEVRETETLTRAAVALLIDQSFSMVVNDTWRTAKTMALALHALATTAFPLDAVEIIAFANLARGVHPHELPDLEASDIQGTNLQHALHARRPVPRPAPRRRSGSSSSSPTASRPRTCDPTARGGSPGRPRPRRSARPSPQVDRMTRRGCPSRGSASATTRARPGSSTTWPVATAGGCCAVAGDRLGDYVVTDYVRAAPRVALPSMSEQPITWLTQEAYDRLQAELADREGPTRHEIKKRIEAAREEGDLKENGGYHAAREEQGKNEARVRQLKHLLEHARIGAPEAEPRRGRAGQGRHRAIPRLGRGGDVPARLPGGGGPRLDRGVLARRRRWRRPSTASASATRRPTRWPTARRCRSRSSASRPTAPPPDCRRPAS